MSNYNNVNKVLIGDGTNSGVITELSGIQKGDLFLIDENHNIVADATAAGNLAKHERLTIAAGIDNGLAILSSPIQGNTVSKYEGTKYVAPSEMVAILGYNGTPGTGISISAEEEYRLRVLIKDTHRFNGQRSTISDVNYQAGVSDTEADVAYKIACLYYQTDYDHNYMNDKVTLERVADGTAAAPTLVTSFAKGSDIIGSTAHGLTGTGYVRLGATSQDAVYGYTVIDANTIKLDVGLQTDTVNTIADLTVTTEWGFKLTGIAQDSKISRGANEPLDQYEWILFDAAFTNADDLSSSQYSADYTLAQAVNPGQGYWKQVADIEEAAKGNSGDTAKRNFWDQRIASNVVVDQGYDSIIITHAAVMRGNFQDTYNAPLKTEIYVPTGGTGQGDEAVATEFLGILNGYFNGVLSFPAIDFTP